MHLTEGMEKGAETAERVKAQELIIGSVQHMLDSYDHNPDRNKLKKASRMIDTAGEIEEEITRMGSPSREKVIQTLMKNISDKEIIEIDNSSSSSEMLSDEKENI